MEKRTMYKRCIAWILTLVMVLNVVNLPAFTLGVKAEDVTTHTVTFDSGDGTWDSGEKTKTETVNDNEIVPPPAPAPTREGYVFKYWYDASGDGTKEFDFATKIGTDITLKAKWNKLYTVKFDTDGGTWKEEKSQTVEEGETVTKPAPAPTKEGYVFKYWYDASGDETKEFDFATKIGTDIRLKAKWNKLYTVKFNVAGGTWKEEESQTVEEGEKVTEPANAPTRKGYEFEYWYDASGDGTKEFDFATKIEKDITLKAKWEQVEFTVEFDANEGTLTGAESVKVKKKETVAKPSDPKRDGYVFKYWYDASGDETKEFDFATKIGTDIRLKAKWNKLYTVKFNVAGGTWKEEESQTVEEGEKVTEPANAPTRKGYEFEYWYDASGDETKKFDFTNTTITGDITLKAHWKQNEIEVTVTGTYIYNEKPQQAKFTVKDKKTGETLKEKDDYIFTYDNNTNAGTATVKVTGKGSYTGKTGSGTFEIKKGVLDPKYTPVVAYCGQKLSEIVVHSDGVKGQFKWNYTGEFTENTMMSDGAEYTISATFEPENKNYENNKDVKIIVKPIHDFDKLTNLEHHEEKEVNEEEGEAGSREYYYCTACGKYYDALEHEQAKEYFIVPYVEESITVTLGSGNTSIDKYVTDGKEGVDSQIMESPSKYKNYLTFDEKTGTINTPKSKKYYKKKIKNPTIVVTDKAGDTYKVTVKLVIEKPKLKKPEKKKITRNSEEYLGYTISCEAKEADAITISVVSGLSSKQIKKRVNNTLKQTCKKNIIISKKKAKVTIRIAIAKKYVKGNKVTFQAVATYGKNKSEVCEKSR